MRDILVTLLVFAGCVYTLRKAYGGILLWSWLSYMNPHRQAWGFAYNMPFAYITAIVLFVSMLVSKDVKKLPINGLTVLWIIFVLFMGLTTYFSYYPDAALTQYTKIVKIQLLIFITMMLITDLSKLRQLIWIIALSIGYYSVKGGIFTIVTAGAHRVYGPGGSFIEENNSLAVAILMTIPLMVYLYQASIRKWVKMGLLGAAILSSFTVIGSQSRGALIAIAAVGLTYMLKSRYKFVSLITVTIIGLSLWSFAPDAWFERMGTIKEYEEDNSAMGRLNAWQYAINAANDNFLGVGLESWKPAAFAIYAPNPLDVHAAHSIYFSVLADHGWIGLIMFVLIFYISLRKLKKIVHLTNDNTELNEINQLARMMQVSFIAYLVGGAFLSLSYFDLPWHLVSFVVIIEYWIIPDSYQKNNNSLFRRNYKVGNKVIAHKPGEKYS